MEAQKSSGHGTYLFTIMFNAKVETIENGLMESLLHKMNLTIM